jgi:general secretion pathway protein D
MPVPGVAGSPDDIIQAGVIKFNEADLAQVLDIYQELTGRTILRPASLPQTKITIKTQTELTRREAILALDSILSLNQITMVPQGEKFVKAVPQGQAATEAPRFNELPSPDLPEAGTIVAQVVRLTNSLPKDIAPALQPFAKMPNSILGIDAAGIIVLRDYAENVKRMMEIIEKIDVVPLQEFEPVVIPIKYALAADIAQVLGSLTAGGGGGTTVGRQQTRTGLTGPSTGMGMQPGMGGTYPGAYPGQTGMQQTGMGTSSGFGSSSAGRSSFADRLRNIVSRASSASGDIVVLGQTKIIADERINALLIFATKADLVAISNIIEKLDVVLPQVLIEALIFQVALNENMEYGISYLQKSPSTFGNQGAGIGALKNTPPGFLDFQNFTGSGSNGVGGLPGGFSYLTRWNNDLDITATAIAGDGRVNVLSRPRVQTSHAVEANLFVGQTRPYPTGSSYGGLYGGYNSIQQLQIGITLSVLPLINPDGLVVMDIRQKIQDVGEDVQIENVGAVPSTIDREANAKVSVRDRETVVLGGFLSTEKRKSKSGVPLLKDLPLLGVLFRSTRQSDIRAELMIMIRPTVLPTPEVAAKAAQEYKGQMRGVSRLERDLAEDERKEALKSQKELLNENRSRKDLLKQEGLPAD